MSLLNISLPTLKSGEAPVEFAAAQQLAPSEWYTHVPVLPQGLAFRQRVELMTRMACEERRLQQVHADPNAHKMWTAVVSDEEEDAEEASEDDRAEGRQQASSRKKKFVKLTDDDLLVNWYDLLKLEQEDAATDDEIRAAYRRRCLETHPDKQQDHSDELFKKVQRAFDILGDAEARMTYDSSRPFDDAIPGETVGEANFYSTFSPVFERNKKWSKDNGLPSLGTDKTPHKDVMRFYDRWSGYQSWRDFSHLVELEEIDEGMCREEKRFYMRENERMLGHHRREEQKRIRTLVERARKNDPRLRRKREQDEAKRQKEIDDREAFRRQIREAEERRRAEEANREKAKEDERVRKLQQSKDSSRQANKDLVNFLKEHDLLDETRTNKLLSSVVRRPNVSWLFSKLTTLEDILEVVETVTSASTERVKKANRAPNDDEEDEVEAVLIFNDFVLDREKMIGLTRYGEAIKKVQVEKRVRQPAVAKSAPPAAPAPVEWSEEDLSRLQKATAKFPPGSVDRWANISAQLRGRFTEEQAMVKVGELTAALHAAGQHQSPEAAAVTAAVQASSVEDWSVVQQKQLEQGLRELKDYKEKDKYQKIAKLVEGKTAKDCFERYRFLCSLNKRK